MFGELLDGAIVSIVRRYQPIARVKQLQHRHVSREPRGKRGRPDATLEGRDARFERGAVGCALAAVAIAARIAAIRVALEGGREIDRLRQRPGCRLGGVGAVHAQGVLAELLTHREVPSVSAAALLLPYSLPKAARPRRAPRYYPHRQTD